MDDKALRNARKNLIGGAILLPIALLILIAGLSQGRLSFLWVGISAACVIYMGRSYQQLEAAKSASQPIAAQPQPSQFGGFGRPATPSDTTRFETASQSGYSVNSLPQAPTATTPASPPSHRPATHVDLPAPGWYQDPNRDTRWWDGGNWTQHVSPRS